MNSLPPDRYQFHQSLALSASREVNLALVWLFLVCFCFGLVFGFFWVCLVFGFCLFLVAGSLLLLLLAQGDLCITCTHSASTRAKKEDALLQHGPSAMPSTAV